MKKRESIYRNTASENKVSKVRIVKESLKGDPINIPHKYILAKKPNEPRNELAREEEMYCTFVYV